MQASAWNDGKNTYGIRVGKPNREKYFDPEWKKIEIEIDGHFHTFDLTPSFWRNCPEFRDSGEPVIREWLQRNHSLEWPRYQPPKVELVPLAGCRRGFIFTGNVPFRHSFWPKLRPHAPFLPRKCRDLGAVFFSPTDC
jgi:hypothetical protein